MLLDPQGDQNLRNPASESQQLVNPRVTSGAQSNQFLAGIRDPLTMMHGDVVLVPTRPALVSIALQHCLSEAGDPSVISGQTVMDLARRVRAS